MQIQGTGENWERWDIKCLNSPTTSDRHYTSIYDYVSCRKYRRYNWTNHYPDAQFGNSHTFCSALNRHLLEVPGGASSQARSAFASFYDYFKIFFLFNTYINYVLLFATMFISCFFIKIVAMLVMLLLLLMMMMLMWQRDLLTVPVVFRRAQCIAFSPRQVRKTGKVGHPKKKLSPSPGEHYKGPLPLPSDVRPLAVTQLTCRQRRGARGRSRRLGSRVPRRRAPVAGRPGRRPRQR